MLVELSNLDKSGLGTIPQSGGYETPKLALGFHTRDLIFFEISQIIFNDKSSKKSTTKNTILNILL
ncbi:MAG: hypothetical protein CVU62_14885 [Deltaproteobacteria bacterium HGW-Deltaproteobacteria-2]|nr:MAG: hypothetical protein CVU62_14885 [Deltaproteobacteria bacterium HGW-Deltaproteobacteria-2]